MDPRLHKAIGNPRIQQHAGELVELALRALEDLKQLDESLYERFVANRTAPVDPTTNAATLRHLWDTTFRGLLSLLGFCRELESTAPKSGDLTEVSEVNFDFGDLEKSAPSAPALEADLGASFDSSFGSGDIGDLLENIDEHVQDGDAERWARVLEKVESIEYGLRSQHTEATARLGVALGAGETNQVLGLLDDTQSSANEGVHALVTAVYSEFLPDVNASSLLPGYHTSLGRALMVRRGLAELQTTLDPFNALLQSPSARSHDFALRTVRATMHTFVGSMICRAMRAADRWQMVEFERELVEQPLAAARMTSEGLVKYLDSLRSINQREVLLLHDQRTLEEIRDALSNARQLVDLSPRTAYDMLERAYHAAQRLRGRHPNTDQLIIELEEHAPAASNAADSVKLLEHLEAVLTAAN